MTHDISLYMYDTNLKTNPKTFSACQTKYPCILLIIILDSFNKIIQMIAYEGQELKTKGMSMEKVRFESKKCEHDDNVMYLSEVLEMVHKN